MSNRNKSYLQILRSSSVIGGASVINIVVSLLRIKVAAVILGPSGIGLIGLFANVMSTAAALAGLGFGSAGTRQIAEAAARDDVLVVATARRALFWGSLVLAVVGGILLWSLRRPIAHWVLNEAARADDIGWLGFGVALTVASASQGALLNGLRRVGDLAKITVLGGVLSTTLGLAALWLFGDGGLIAFVIAGPLGSFILGHYFVARLPAVSGPRPPMGELASQWRTLARLGIAFMLAAFANSLTQLFVRALVQRDLGSEALGYFQASWIISMSYSGLILGAMSTDFYPRLTGVIRNLEQSNRLVNEQTEIAILLAGPLFLTMLALAPWLIEVLYTNSFAPAVQILRWQILGDVLKLASWPLAFILLASGDGRTFVISEVVGLGVFAATCYLAIPWFGVQATGIASLTMYVFYLPLVYSLARRRTGFTWEVSVWRSLTAVVVLAVAVALVAAWQTLLGIIIGLSASLLFSIYALHRVAHMTALGSTAGRLGAIYRQILAWLGVWRE